jgi:hypothetical protein
MEEEEANLAGIVLKRVKSQGLMMSRVPQNTRDEFVRIAEEEFAGDYGLFLKSLLDDSKLLAIIVQNYEYQLKYMIEILEEIRNKINNQNEKKPVKKMLNGRTVEKEV